MTIGEEIQKELDKKGLSQREFCKRADMIPSHLNYIINGQRKINVRVAILLELYFIKTASYWMQKLLEEEIKEAKEKDGRF